jgi:hypothetical protein
MQGHAEEPQKLPEKSGASIDCLKSQAHTGLECCREPKASLLIEGVLSDGVSKEEELLIDSRLLEGLAVFCCCPIQEQPLTMSIGYLVRCTMSGRRQRYHKGVLIGVIVRCCVCMSCVCC